jgi:hypothetical protein
MHRVHSKQFIARWQKMLIELYGYKEMSGTLFVPSFMGKGSAVYLPLLSYSDIDVQQAEQLAKELEGASFQIRVLDGACSEFEPGDTVTLRMDIAGKSIDDVFGKIIPGKRRNQIRKTDAVGLELRSGVDENIVNDFYSVFSTTMYRHGTPVFGKKLFDLLPRHVNAQFLVAYHQNVPVAGLCLVFDERLAWVPWSGSLTEYNALSPNIFLYWRAIQQAVQAGMEIFDFGRSGYLAPTYAFKQQWGAKPVKVVTVSSTQNDVYKRYTLASKLWRRLPKVAVDRVGPVLCKYLADL